MMYIGYVFMLEEDTQEELIHEGESTEGKEFFIIEAENVEEAREKLFNYYWPLLNRETKELCGYAGCSCMDILSETDKETLKDELDLIEKIYKYNEEKNMDDAYFYTKNIYGTLSDKALFLLSKKHLRYDTYVIKVHSVIK